MYLLLESQSSSPLSAIYFDQQPNNFMILYTNRLDTTITLKWRRREPVLYKWKQLAQSEAAKFILRRGGGEGLRTTISLRTKTNLYRMKE
jgi:hypothetical protein